MKNFTFIRETSILRLSCWKQLLMTALLIMATVLTSFTLTAQNLPGTVPVLTPVGGFGIDGDAYANTPTPGIGDWFNTMYAGSGGSLFNADGTVKDPSMTYFLQDDWGGTDATIFTSSNKINDNPTTYTWGPGNVPNKNEIQNVGAHFAYGNPALPGGVADELWCIFAADRQVVNGDAYIDFEFLQKSLTMTGLTSGGFASEGTANGRTVGDLLVTVIFTNGGTSAEVQIRIWEPISGGYGYILHPNSEFIGDIFVTNNNAITNVPFDVYGTTPGVYVPNQWVEGAVNLTKLLNFGTNPCAQVSTLFVRTKTSQSVTAELKDFPGIIQLELGIPELTVNCPGNMTMPACSTQEQINTAFAAWKAGFSYGGGVPPITESYAYTGGAVIGSNLNSLLPPNICGGSVSITYTATDYCEQTDSCSATFTVTAPPALVISDVQNMTVNACSYANQAAVNAAFNTWLQGFTVSGGCNPQGSYGTPVAPLLCAGGYVDVTYNVTDLCGSGSDTARFTLNAPPAVTVSDVQNMTTSACLYANQAAVDAEFAAWLTGFTTGGGCNPVGSFVGTPVAPDLCGGSTMVTYNVTDLCDNTKQDVATFTITAPPALVISNVQDLTIPGCYYGSQGALNTAFTNWLAGFTVSGGCNPIGVFAETYNAPDVMAGGFVDVVYNVTDLCETGSDTARFTVEPCILDQFCSYTQGYYGNPGGSSCDGESTYTTYGLIEKALDDYPGDVMRIGVVGKSILIAKTEADINKVIEYLPGGKSSYELSSGNISISDILFKNWYTTTVGKNNTTINNALLAQTITLGLNLGMDNDLGAFALQEGTFATAELDGGCGSTIAKERYCEEGVVYNEYQYYAVMGNIAGAASNVNELFALANRALGNVDGIVGTEDGISLADIAKAVDMINNAFDECRMFMGYGIEPLECGIVLAKVTVANKVAVTEEPTFIDSSVDFKVYPVPFEDIINVSYRFEYDTDVTIQIFNLQGALIYGVVDNMYNNGEVAVKQISLPGTFDQALIVRLTTNKEKLSKTIVAKSSTQK